MGIELSPLLGRLLLATGGLLLMGLFGWLAVLPKLELKLGLQTQARPRGTRYVSEAEYQREMLLQAQLQFSQFMADSQRRWDDSKDRIFGTHLHWSVLACLGSAAVLSASMLYGNLLPAESYAWLGTFRFLIPLVLLTALGALELWAGGAVTEPPKADYSDVREAKREMVKFKLSFLPVTFFCGALNTALALIVGWLFY